MESILRKAEVHWKGMVLSKSSQLIAYTDGIVFIQHIKWDVYYCRTQVSWFKTGSKTKFKLLTSWDMFYFGFKIMATKYISDTVNEWLLCSAIKKWSQLEN